MDFATLLTTAFTFVTPFVLKSGEAIAEKAGEDIWNVLKKPFERKGKELTKENFLQKQEEVKQQLLEELSTDTNLQQTLRTAVENAQRQVSGNYQQNIHAHGEVGKQINIQTNAGNITM